MKNQSKPLVTVHCVTYNHEKYIAQAIESLVGQKTNFKFEILIHDDDSTDQTTKIIRDFEKKYPSIIKPIYESSNQWSLGNDGFIKSMFLSSKGEYIAECEGDDYWIDEYKLQKQVDFMKANPSFALCFHPVKIIYEKSNSPDDVFPQHNNISKFTTGHLLKSNFIQSNSVMYRRLRYDTMPTNIMPLDWYMHLYHAKEGKIGFIDEVMSVYRRHPGGVWWGTASRNLDIIWNKYGIGHIRLYEELLRLYGDNLKYKKIINEHIMEMIFNICTVKNINKENIDTLLSQYQGYVADYLNKISKDKVELEDKKTLLISDINKNSQEIQTKNNEILSYKDEILSYKDEITHLENELNSIKNSKAWDVIQKYRKLHNSIFRR